MTLTVNASYPVTESSLVTILKNISKTKTG